MNSDDEQDDDDDQIEYGEDGYPTDAQVQRWRELDEAAAKEWLEQTEKVIAEDARDWAAAGFPPRLITDAELRAAGVFDVPAWMRKSLRNERDLFTDLPEDAG